MKSKRDILALIPTGGGKSLIFQLAAITDPGVTIVIMPLLALIEDNLNFVRCLNIKAANLSGTLKPETKRYLLESIKTMQYKIVYTTPESFHKNVEF